MNIYDIVTKDNLVEEVGILWPAVCRILNVDPQSLIKPGIRWTSDEALSSIGAETAVLGPGREAIYLSQDQEITRRILAHELAHYIVVQTEKDEGEFVPQWIEEQLIAI